MDKEQLIEKVKKNPKRTAVIVILLLLLFYNSSSNDSREHSRRDEDSPYGNVTMSALEINDRQTNETDDEEPSIQAPAEKALLIQMKTFFGFDTQKPAGVRYATTILPEGIEYLVRKPATYASKIVVKNISPCEAIMGSAAGFMSVGVLQPMHASKRGDISLEAYSKAEGNDFWTMVFYDKLKVGYVDEEAMNLDMLERHQWSSIPYKGQVVAEIVPEGFIKLTYMDESGKVVRTVTTQKKAVAFRISGSDMLMNAEVEFYR